MTKTLHILAIGSNKWNLKIRELCYSFIPKFEIEFISNINIAKDRLNHNSYDILLIEDEYINRNSIVLSKMAYAMSRPTVIMCNSIFRLVYYYLWKKFAEWPNKFKISKKMIQFKYINNISFLLDKHLIFDSHNNLKNISNEIISVLQ